MMIRNPISIKDAITRVIKKVVPIGSEKVDLEEADGRILAEPIIATHDVPPFNRSPYDGYAIRSCDSIHASVDTPVRFKVIGTIGAGSVFQSYLNEGEAVRIMTGAPIPDEADAIVMLEDTQLTEEDSFVIKRPFQSGENVSYLGEDVKKGEELIKEANVGQFIKDANTVLSGYVYNDGTFHFDGEALLKNGRKASLNWKTSTQSWT